MNIPIPYLSGSHPNYLDRVSRLMTDPIPAKSTTLPGPPIIFKSWDTSKITDQSLDTLLKMYGQPHCYTFGASPICKNNPFVITHFTSFCQFLFSFKEEDV